MIIGVLGAGQLGRMLALAGYPLGFRFRFLAPAAEAAVDPLAERLVGDYEDRALLERFGKGLDVVTYEFENVPFATARFLAQRVPVYPPPEVLEAAQDRLNEKSLFQRLAIPTPSWVPVDSKGDLLNGLTRVGLPAVLKKRRFGYDGKGQFMLRRRADAELALQTVGEVPLLLESFVPFERELSILGVRGRDGETAFYPLVENHHREGILRLSVAPAPDLAQELKTLAENYARRILEAVSYVGVLAIEFFQYKGQLLANEMAPRVHNSGHWTIEGAETSQFENHLRAVAGLPLGSTASVGHSAMLNLIGATPAREAILAVPGAHLHLYDKAPHPGRKLGHVTVRSPDMEGLQTRLAHFRARPELAALLPW